MKKNIFGLLIMLLVLLIPLTFVSASTSKDDDVEISLKKYLGKNYKERIIKNTSSAKKIENINSMFGNTFSESTDILYPDYIGGLYIDDNDEVVIQIVKENIPNNSKANSDYNLYNKVLSTNQDAKVVNVKYSYNEINNVIKILEEYYSNNYETGNIDGFYDDIINNRVVVELKKYSEDEIEKIKKEVIDSPLIHFIESRNTTEYLTTYSPGQGILPLGCSIGFRAKVGNNIGFVTAGHCVTGLNQSVVSFGVVKKYNYGGNIDASWIQLDPLYSIGNSLKYHPQTGLSWSIDNRPVTSFAVGELYGKSGASSQYTYGKITSLSVSMNGISKLVNTSVYATNGDSGGIVFKISGTGTKPTAYRTAGIVHGGPTGGGNMVFVKANSIVSSFGLTTY